jgi:hypothetical protein
MEEWRKHPKWDVEVSTHGRVRRNGRVKKLTVKHQIGGDYHVTSVGGRGVPIQRVARLVLETFKGVYPDLEARHMNGRSLGDRLDNLEWGNRLDQLDDKKRIGTHKPPPVMVGEDNPATRYTERDYIRAFRMLGRGASLRLASRLTGISRTQLRRVIEHDKYSNLRATWMRENPYINRIGDNPSGDCPF